MNQLYTPWRMRYLRGETKKEAVDCVFCDRANNPQADAVNYVVARSQFVYVVLNIYPYNNGHVMVIPYTHVPTPEALPPEALADLMLTINRSMAAIRDVYQPQGYNIGANLGAIAGAGIADHFHMHIVPRWAGDSSYMSVVGQTRVIPETLEDTWRKLRDVWPTNHA
ncbi:MAG TPA: HIT domain-containing protein [Aggregatilineales bacterium]|nr:HIT domain-containing protein [Aggregatilineales bacterium]